MIETVMTAQMRQDFNKNKEKQVRARLYTGGYAKIKYCCRVHGDELQGQYICYELIRRIKEEREHLRGIVDIYPCVTPMALEIRKRNARVHQI